MKKTIQIFIVCMCALFLFAGCRNGNADESSTPTTSTPVTTVAPTTPPTTMPPATQTMPTITTPDTGSDMGGMNGAEDGIIGNGNEGTSGMDQGNNSGTGNGSGTGSSGSGAK